MHEEEKQSQEYPEVKYKSFEETATVRTRIEAAGRGVDRLKPTIGGKLQETKTGTQFFQIKETKGEILTDDYYKATVDTCFTQMIKKGDQYIWKKGSSGNFE